MEKLQILCFSRKSYQVHLVFFILCFPQFFCFFTNQDKVLQFQSLLSLFSSQILQKKDYQTINYTWLACRHVSIINQNSNCFPFKSKTFLCETGELRALVCLFELFQVRLTIHLSVPIMCVTLAVTNFCEWLKLGSLQTNKQMEIK